VAGTPVPAVVFGRGLGLFPSPANLECWLSVWRLFKEFLAFAWQEKKWWLIPLVAVLLVVAAILVFASSSGIAWALYPFF
jgi:hypothetical protein